MNKSFQTSGGWSHRKSNEFVHLVKCWLVDRAPESRKSWFPIISPKKHDCILTGWHETSVWTELWLRQTFFFVKDFKTSLVGSLMEDSRELLPPTNQLGVRTPQMLQRNRVPPKNCPQTFVVGLVGWVFVCCDGLNRQKEPMEHTRAYWCY